MVIVWKIKYFAQSYAAGKTQTHFPVYQIRLQYQNNKTVFVKHIVLYCV